MAWPNFLTMIFFGLAMSAISLVGALTLIRNRQTLKKIVRPLVGLASGSLIGGAFFHLIPNAINSALNRETIFLFVGLGFTILFLTEQFFSWHHSHTINEIFFKKPLGFLILLADGLHNFIGGLSVGAAFVSDLKLGIITWVVAAAHEIPQEFGDFGILIHSNWKIKSALVANFLSSLTFLLGGIIAFFISGHVNVGVLLAFGAGNFIYIGASDLIPIVKQQKGKKEWSPTIMYLMGSIFVYLLIYF